MHHSYFRRQRTTCTVKRQSRKTVLKRGFKPGSKPVLENLKALWSLGFEGFSFARICSLFCSCLDMARRRPRPLCHSCLLSVRAVSGRRCASRHGTLLAKKKPFCHGGIQTRGLLIAASRKRLWLPNETRGIPLETTTIVGIFSAPRKLITNYNISVIFPGLLT
jgi:hypothetical protein